MVWIIIDLVMLGITIALYVIYRILKKKKEKLKDNDK